MNIPYIQTERKQEIVLLILNRPESANTLSQGLLEELKTKLLTISIDDSIRALIITGAGSNFGLGADRNDLEQMITLPRKDAHSYFRKRIKLLEEVIITITNMPQIVIAAINGQAAGASFSLALACDMRIISNRTKLNFAYGNLGLSTDGGMTWFLPQIVGIATARMLLINQKVIRATQALQLGIAIKSVATAELIDNAIHLAKEVANTAKYSTQCAKQMLNLSHMNSASLATHLTIEHALFEQGLFEQEFIQIMSKHSKRQGN